MIPMSSWLTLYKPDEIGESILKYLRDPEWTRSVEQRVQQFSCNLKSVAWRIQTHAIDKSR
jgi:hypothetical protein